MTRSEENNESNPKPEFKSLDLTSHLPSWMQRDIKLSEVYTDFTLCFLMRKRKGIGKIDQLVLDHNGAEISLSGFIDKQNATEYGYAEIIKQTDKYIKLRITESGIWKYENISQKIRAKSPSWLKRIKLFISKKIQKAYSFIFVSGNKRVKKIMESGFIKLILFLFALVTFILKWDQIKQLIHKLTE